MRDPRTGARVVRVDVVGAVDELVARLFEELDYANEAANCDRFGAMYDEETRRSRRRRRWFGGRASRRRVRGRDGGGEADGGGAAPAATLPAPGVRVPRLDAECTRRVLALEWVDGDKLLDSEPRGGDGAGVARLAVAPSDLPLVELGIECTLSQLLDTGFLHADPHGGNLLKAPCGAAAARSAASSAARAAAAAAQQQQQLVYLDFGLVARVPAPVRDGLVAAVAHLVDRDVDAVVGLLGELMLSPRPRRRRPPPRGARGRLRARRRRGLRLRRRRARRRARGALLARARRAARARSQA